MHAIKPANKEFPWIIGPYREVADTGSIRTWLDIHVKAYNAKYVCVDGLEASFSLYEGMDFGKTLNAITKHKRYLYLEQRDEGYVFIHIKEGALIQDSILTEPEDLEAALSFIALINENDQKGSYFIEHFGLFVKSGTENYSKILNQLTETTGACRELSNSHLETVDVADLKEDDVFYFVEFKNAVRDLADTKTQKITVLVIGMIIAIYWIFSADVFELEEKKERLELVDDYKEYTESVLNGFSFSARLAQDFTIHKLLSKELANWKLYKVTHTVDTIEYRVLPQSHIASVAGLTLFANHYDMAVLNDSNGLGVVAAVDKQLIYNIESEVRRYPLEALTANIIDIESNITPFATVAVKRTDKHGLWSARELSIMLNGASKHDLLRLAAIVDGYPERYPALFSSCQSQGCSYDVSPQGILKGAINFTIYGSSLGGNSNG